LVKTLDQIKSNEMKSTAQHLIEHQSNQTHCIASLRDWYTQGKLSSYVDGMWSLGTGGTSLIAATQPGGDMSDPAVPQITLGLTVPISGKYKYKVDFGAGVFESVGTNESELVVLPTNYANSIVIDSPHKILALSFSVLDFQSALENTCLPAKTDLGALHASTFQDDFLKHGLNRLRAWCSPEHAGFALAKEGLVLAMVLRMAELAGNSKLPTLTARTGTLAGWQVKRVLEQFQANLTTSPTLGDLAKSVGLSKFHFCRAFAQTMGCSPMQYLTDQRLAQATALLKTSNLAIADLAMQVGYDDPSYFARLYRLKNGVTPKTVRQASN
jgi:AraC family transcriptional regulator